MQANFVLNEKM